MVATATIKDDTGGTVNTPSGAGTTVTNLRYKEADNNTQDLNNPVTIPSAGTKYSYWKHNWIEFTSTFTQIDNINWFVTSFDWTGTTLWIGDGTQTHTSASDAGYDPAVGLNILTTHDTITTQTNAGTTYTNSGSGRTVSISEAGNVVDASGETSDYFVTNLELTTSATSGTQTAKTVTVEYDEI
jgi:hypothetical protein